MGTIVVDNSVLLPLFLADEAKDYSRSVIRQNTNGERLIAPALCVLEFGSGILKAVRRNRITEAEAASAYRKLALLTISFQRAPASDALPPIHTLARRHGLTFYDAAYLALALDTNARLASLDNALRNAAQAEGITLY